MERIDIGLAAWIVQDGNYPDFHRGQIAEFALEFAPGLRTTIALERAGAKGARPLGNARYEIAGEVVYVSRHVWLLNFGIRAFQDMAPPEGIHAGASISADIDLGIDSSSYSERLFKLPGMPPLIYTWHVDRISRQTAPFVEDLEGRGFLVRDESRLGYEEIDRTNAWKDDDGHASYILHCTKLGHEPKYTSATTA